MIVQSGEATLVYGGQVIDPQPSAPNEIQGSGIKGGTRITVKAGDVIHIPTGIPHQFFFAPGKQITYMLVKVVVNYTSIASKRHRRLRFYQRKRLRRFSQPGSVEQQALHRALPVHIE
jgi:mannose-6-phosphate isomerase-like protein (cupin superfamily)